MIALGIIAKDEVAKLKNIIDKYGKFFDQIHIAYDNLKVEEVKNDNVFLHSYIWINDFSHKRNYLANKIKASGCDYYFTIDCDDEIENPEGIKNIYKKAKDQDVSIVYLPYEYSKDEFGNVNAAHNKERLIKCTDNLFWNKKIHENVLPKSMVSHKVVIDTTVKVIHIKTHEEYADSLERNSRYLIKEFNEDRENTDPRTLAYLGRGFMALKDHDKAIYFLQRHIEKCGWDEDKCTSFCQLAEIFREKQDYDKAISCATEALLIRPDYPDPYLTLHSIYQERQMFDKAIEWGEMGLKRQLPQTMMITDPSAYTWRPALSMSFCYLQIGEYEKAWKLFSYAKKLAPTVEFVVQNEKMYRMAYEHKNFMESFVKVYNFIKEREENKLPDLVNSIPSELNENELVCKLKATHLPNKTHADNEVTIMCSCTLDTWSPKSVESGIGGSEEAVIHLSNELTKLGYVVTVYNNCGEDEGVYNGVRYVNYYKFNPKDKFNIIISWRVNIFAHFTCFAKKKLVWLHDVIQDGSVEKPESYDKVIVLSDYHKSLLPEFVPEEKIYVSANGINIEDFKNDGIVRMPHRVIYASSYDRGLEHLLEMWPDVLKEVPDAELHVFYGWNNYDKFVADGTADGAFKTRMVEKLKQKGVYEHGRIGHKELKDEFYKAGVWAYPCTFKEISCITAMKAQACGCAIISTDYAALKNTLKTGTIINGCGDDKEVQKKFKEALIDTLKNGKKHGDVDKSMFAWSKIANEWDRDLFKPKRFVNNYSGLDEYKQAYEISPVNNISPLEKGLTLPRFEWACDYVKSNLDIKSSLDIGTFDGLLPLELGTLGINATGIDINRNFITKGIEYKEANKVENVKLLSGVALEEFDGGKYDLITAFEVIEHVLDLDVFYKKIDELLNNGGHLLISTPHKNGKYGEYNLDAHHLRFFDEESLAKSLPQNYKLIRTFVEPTQELLCAEIRKA